MKTRGRVVVVGTLNIDRIWQVPRLPHPGETVLATTTEQQFGGKGANQAVAAARLGATVALVGAVGNDSEGQLYRERLGEEGIDVGGLLSAPATTGTAHVYVDPKGENLIVVHPGANALIERARLTAALRGADVMLVQLECELDVAVEALRQANAHGARGILNASPTRADFPWGGVAIDTVIVNEHECRECFDASPVELSGMSGRERQALLQGRKVANLVVTQGASPTLYFSGELAVNVPAYAVEPRDTVGAGDTFAGALAAELASGSLWPEALRYANVAAALSTLALGAQAAMPRRAEVEAVLAQTPS
jgi:ribokinase